MQMDPRLNCEYERAYPRTQPYSRLPYDKRAEKAWWADYYRRNPTADAAGPAAQGRALTRPYHCVQKFDRMQSRKPAESGLFVFGRGSAERPACANVPEPFSFFI